MHSFPRKVGGDKSIFFTFFSFLSYSVNKIFSLCFLKLEWLLFDFDSVSLKPIALVLLWLLVAQKSLDCGWAALTVGQRLPYCGPTTFLPFKASPALSSLLRSQEDRAIAVAPPFPAHNSVTVINTLRIQCRTSITTFQSGPRYGAAGGGSAHDLFSWCQLLLSYRCHNSSPTGQ